MNASEKRLFVNQFASDLRILSEILSKTGLSIAGSRDIHAASYHLRKGDSGISFDVPDIDLMIDGKQRFMPPSLKLEDRLLVDISFEQNFSRTPDPAEMLEQITRNSMKFSLRGMKGNKKLVSAWHFDRHGYATTAPSPCHPRFHFQFGGFELKEFADKVDGILVLDTPRHFAPPLDPILAADVLVSHFNGPAWHVCRDNDPRYVAIVRRAQQRLWKPYFEKISNELDPVAESMPPRVVEYLPNVL